MRALQNSTRVDPAYLLRIGYATLTAAATPSEYKTQQNDAPAFL